MSKLSLYDATFPFTFDDLIKNLEYNDDSVILKAIKKRNDFCEFKFTKKLIQTEEYLDINNNINFIDKLILQEFFFRVYNRSNNNLIIFNEPRSILKLKNHLSKITNFQFSLVKNFLDLNYFLVKNLNHIKYISKIDVHDIIHKDQIFEKRILYTQNDEAFLLNILHKQLQSPAFKIYKVDFFLKNLPSSKITITHDFKIFQKTDNPDNLLNIILDIL